MDLKRMEAPLEGESVWPAPEGWRRVDIECGMGWLFGPVHVKPAPEGGVRLGFRCTERHLNPAGACHGAALAAFADYAGLGAQFVVGPERLVMPTITLSLDFLDMVRLGDWVEADFRILKRTAKLCFTEMHCHVEGRPAMSSRAIFKITDFSRVGDSAFYRNFLALWREMREGGES